MLQPARIAVIAAALFSILNFTQNCRAEVRVEKSEHGAAITIDGKPFAEYWIKNGHQPIIWPIVGPGGQKMTRQYPMGDLLPGESNDHPHHRSLWFNHGVVNGKDFWKEPDPKEGPEGDNQIVHRDFEKMESGNTGVLITNNDWTSGGKKICEDQRVIQFGADGHGRWIDFAATVKASEGDLVFGDSKEGAFGLRVAGTMSVASGDNKQGGKIITSEGHDDADAWGRSAKWVDYHGLVDEMPVGIAIFDLPDSFRHPTRWHVRTYGLFAANPFGQKEFTVEDREQGEAKVKKGETLKVHYRVLFYEGELKPAELDEINKGYAATAPCPCE